MLADDFEDFWVKMFKDSPDNALLDAMVNSLKEKKLIKNDADLQKFCEVWEKLRPDHVILHSDECMNTIKFMVKNNLLFYSDEIRSKFRFKEQMEKNLVRWMIDNFDRNDMDEFMKFLLEQVKIAPKHFSNIVCQSLVRLIIDKFRRGEKFGIESLIDIKSNEPNYGLGFLTITEFAGFYMDENHRPMCDDFRSMVECAEKIVMLNDLLEEETINGKNGEKDNQ